MGVPPKVSICIPTHNQAQFLRECVQSALDQTFKDIEVVVSVNHCTDDTEKVLSEFSDPRLRIIKPKRFLPVTENFKFCISQSRSEYFSFLCSDDVLFPKFVESQVKVLDENPDVVFVHAAAERIDLNGNVLRLEKSIYPSFIRKGSEELKRYVFGPKCVGDSALIRRSAYSAAGGVGDNYLLDWELWLRLLGYGDVAYNEEVLMGYRDWADEYRRTTRQLKLLESKVLLYRKYQPIILRQHPGWKRLFKRARRQQALSAVTGLSRCETNIRNEARKYILMLSPTWQVRFKLALCGLGLGPIWIGLDCLNAWLKNHIKSMLYPKQLSK